MARVRALLRRASSASGTPDTLKFGQVEVDFRRYAAHRRGRPVEMTRKEFALLRFLASREDTVVTRDEILNKVWGFESYPMTRTVDNHISSLRAKLETDPARPVHIQTVHGVGYKFVPDETHMMRSHARKPRRMTATGFGLLLTLAVSIGLARRVHRSCISAASWQEHANGDLKQAIALYAQAAQTAGRDRALAAKALIRMAGSQEKLGADAEAENAYAELVRAYPEQRAEVAIAQERLTALRRAHRLVAANPALLPVERVSDTELAARLATFLWNGAPDAPLLEAARRGDLRDPAALNRQVRPNAARPEVRQPGRQLLRTVAVTGQVEDRPARPVPVPAIRRRASSGDGHRDATLSAESVA